MQRNRTTPTGTTDLGNWLRGKNGIVFGMIWQIRKMVLI